MIHCLSHTLSCQVTTELDIVNLLIRLDQQESSLADSVFIF